MEDQSGFGNPPTTLGLVQVKSLVALCNRGLFELSCGSGRFGVKVQG